MIQGWDDLGQGGDSVWDYIGMAQLWLDHPHRRDEFGRGLACGATGPSHADFYVDVLERAKRLGEPRLRIQAR